MRIIRYQDGNGDTHYGVQREGSALRVEGDIFGNHKITDEPASIEKLLAPIMPSQIIGIGLNYRFHAKEAGASIPEHPVVFMKTLNTVQHPDDPIVLPTRMKSNEVDYECELAVVIGRTCKNVTRVNALDYVLGYTCANDVSARDWQLIWGGGQWTRGKCFDTFCPLGPALVTSDEIEEPNNLKIRTVLNDEVVQDWTTSDMVFDVPTLIEFLSGSTTLLAGTVILTGTPHGVGMGKTPPRWLTEGDTIRLEVERIGILSNTVHLE